MLITRKDDLYHDPKVFKDTVRLPEPLPRALFSPTAPVFVNLFREERNSNDKAVRVLFHRQCFPFTVPFELSPDGTEVTSVEVLPISQEDVCRFPLSHDIRRDAIGWRYPGEYTVDPFVYWALMHAISPVLPKEPALC